MSDVVIKWKITKCLFVIEKLQIHWIISSIALKNWKMFALIIKISNIMEVFWILKSIRKSRKYIRSLFWFF